MERMTAAEAVWYALADLHREHPSRAAFDKRAIAAHATTKGYWDRQRQTLYQHLSQWVNAQSPSESARAAFVVGEGRGGPYRLVRPSDLVARNREALPRHPDAGDDPMRRQAVAWYTKKYAVARRRPNRRFRTIEVEDEAARLVHAYATTHGLDETESATLLIRRGLAGLRNKDPMLILIGAAEGDDISGRDHDEVLYG